MYCVCVCSKCTKLRQTSKQIMCISNTTQQGRSCVNRSKVNIGVVAPPVQCIVGMILSIILGKPYSILVDNVKKFPFLYKCEWAVFVGD